MWRLRQLRRRRTEADDARLVKRSGLFDANWYVAEYPDVASRGIDPLEHFMVFGWREKRKPCPYFDTARYLSVNEDVAALSLNPLVHYLRFGWKEGRVPFAGFEPPGWIAETRNGEAGDEHPIAAEIRRQHFAKEQEKDVVRRSGLFDADWYAKEYPDVASRGIDPFEHFMEFGWREKRKPCPYFDTAMYLSVNEDVAALGLNPLVHYLRFGWKEGCIPFAGFEPPGWIAETRNGDAGDEHPIAAEMRRQHLAIEQEKLAKEQEKDVVRRSGLSDADWYAKEYPDIASSGIDPLEHFMEFGWRENRRPCPYFDTKWYLRVNGDVAALGLNPLVHYIRYGWKENRRPFANFDPVVIEREAWDPESAHAHPLVTEMGRRRIPDWLRQQWREAAELDHGIRPETEANFLAHVWRLPRPSRVVDALEQVRSEFAGGFTHVVAVPWMVRGGAELVAAQLVHALDALVGPRAALLVATDAAEAASCDWLPIGSRTLFFSHIEPRLDEYERTELLTHIILQYRPTAVININSAACWRAYSKYPQQLSSSSRLFAFLFGFDFARDGTASGHAIEHLRPCLPHLKGLLFDNETFRRRLIELFGIAGTDQQRMKTLYQPTPKQGWTVDLSSLAGRLACGSAYRRKVLWATRIDVQKRPELLVEIARRLPEMTFVAYGAPVMSRDNPLQRSDLPNLEYRGAFSDFFALPLHEFDLFLHTSKWDGIPTVVLAAMRAGLPVVAAAVGGLPELLCAETGWPLPEDAGADEYCAAIRMAVHSPEQARARIEGARAVIERRHTWSGYLAAIAASGMLSK